MLSFLFGKSRAWLDPQVAQRVEASVRAAEKMTSGEIRVFTERHCSFVDAADRAEELFGLLGMHQTQQRNAVLIYWAVVDRQVAIYADAGIHAKLGQAYWSDRVDQMLSHFRLADPAKALESCIHEVGIALQHHFPYDSGTDRNELPDNLLIGR